jgi:hypothetical protein
VYWSPLLALDVTGNLDTEDRHAGRNGDDYGRCDIGNGWIDD